jgi:hypothetical protein
MNVEKMIENYVHDNPNSGVVVVAHTGDSVCQHHRRLKKDCLKYTSVEDSVPTMKPTGDPAGEDNSALSSAPYFKEAKVRCSENSSSLFQSHAENEYWLV